VKSIKRFHLVIGFNSNSDLSGSAAGRSPQNDQLSIPLSVLIELNFLVTQFSIRKRLPSHSLRFVVARAMVSILDKLQRAISPDFMFQVDHAKRVIIMPVTCDGVRHIVVIRVNEQEETITLMLKYQTKAPEPQRAEMCAFMSHVNQRCNLGGLEMDLEDGECQFRHSVDVEGIILNDAYLHQLVQLHCTSGAHYWPAISAVMCGADYRTAHARLR
jgi:hypothetical protein